LLEPPWGEGGIHALTPGERAAVGTPAPVADRRHPAEPSG